MHLVPRGEFPHAESGKLQVIDDTALSAIVNRFSTESKHPNFAGLLIDQEHFSYDPGKSSASYGWIKEIQNRDDGLWGRVEWTSLGSDAISGGVYRFLSPTWLNRDVEDLGGNRIRPLRLDTAGLTNVPNLKGMVPFTNRAGYTGSDQPETQHMKSIASALGLSTDASEESILAAVTKLQKDLADAKAANSTITNRVTALETDLTAVKTTNTKLLGDIVEQDLEKYKNRFAAEKRDHWKSALIANRDSALELLASVTEPKSNGGTPGASDTTAVASDGKAMHNRSSTNPPTPTDEARKKADARAKKIANRANEIATSQKIPYSQAFNMAKGEFPTE